MMVLIGHGEKKKTYAGEYPNKEADCITRRGKSSAASFRNSVEENSICLNERYLCLLIMNCR